MTHIPIRKSKLPCAHCGCRTLSDYHFGEKKFTDRLYCRTCFRFTLIGKKRIGV